MEKKTKNIDTLLLGGALCNKVNCRYKKTTLPAC